VQEVVRRNQTTISKPYRRVNPTTVLLAFLLSSCAGCSYVRHDDESLNKFARSYVAFRKAAYDSEIVSWVVTLDQSERTNGSNGTSYRRYFAGALDVTASNRVRADSARQAIEYHNSTKIMDDFDTRTDAVDTTSLALVEAANGIGNETYRRQAIGIVDSARKVQHAFNEVRQTYIDTYNLQIMLLTTIVKENGNLDRASPAMQKNIAEKDKLRSELDRLRNEEQASLRQVQEQYAAFEGRTGVTVDYVQPTATQ
jgi:hypothetical protein